MILVACCLCSWNHLIPAEQALPLEVEGDAQAVLVSGELVTDLVHPHWASRALMIHPSPVRS